MAARPERAALASHLAPGRGLVEPVERSPDRQEDETVRAGDGAARGRGIDAEETALLELHLLAVQAHDPRSAQDEVDLLLVPLGVIVLPAFDVRRQLEVVEAKRAGAQRTPHLTDGAPGAFTLEVGDIDVAVAHGRNPRRRARRRGRA